MTEKIGGKETSLGHSQAGVSRGGLPALPLELALT